MDIFKDWLTSHEEDTKAVGLVCKKVLSCGKTDSIRHQKTQMHNNIAVVYWLLVNVGSAAITVYFFFRAAL